MKERITGTNQFKLIHTPFEKLPTREERRWMAFVHTYITEILHADKAAGPFGPEEVVSSVRNIADAICGKDYWSYVIKENTVEIFRTSDNDLVARIIVIKKVNN